ncbi:alpha/beta hydrolase [Mucilaginibacter sp. OK098]|uniref:alpha/beta hydrolase n=1 Tax=Mucilaginibacter sp. OK098 TaxID=1855297 RepID=UPI00091527B7|nr:alpha/beta hydrolase [Mucilaginibacter sp. OK098]SHM42300.1 acetyl esterase [Mucilaginibacter sp. OK098]
MKQPPAETDDLHPVISELLKTKFNTEYRIPAEIHAFRHMMDEFTRIASFSEVESMSIHEMKFAPDDLPEFKILIYNADRDNLKPVLIYFHGGNWIAGSLNTSDSVCRTLAEGSNYVVISVDYALAPEHSFPIPLYQGLEVIDWIKKQGFYYGINRQKIVIGGDNAGGNIAAGLIHLVSQRRILTLQGQLLICPALHYRFDTPSYCEYEKGYLTSLEIIQNSYKAYLGPYANAHSEFASPLLTRNVSHVPPTLIFTAEYDPLRDEAELYADRLKRQGIAVVFNRYKSVTHNFWLMDSILNTARQAQKEAIVFLKKINEMTYAD